MGSFGRRIQRLPELGHARERRRHQPEDRPSQSRSPGAPVLRPGRRAPRRGVHERRRRRRRLGTDRAGEVLLQLRRAAEAKHGGRVLALRSRPAVAQRRRRVAGLRGATAPDPLVASRARDIGRNSVRSRHDHRFVRGTRGSPHTDRRAGSGARTVVVADGLRAILGIRCAVALGARSADLHRKVDASGPHAPGTLLEVSGREGRLPQRDDLERLVLREPGHALPGASRRQRAGLFGAARWHRRPRRALVRRQQRARERHEALELGGRQPDELPDQRSRDHAVQDIPAVAPHRLQPVARGQPVRHVHLSLARGDHRRLAEQLLEIIERSEPERRRVDRRRLGRWKLEEGHVHADGRRASRRQRLHVRAAGESPRSPRRSA